MQPNHALATAPAAQAQRLQLAAPGKDSGLGRLGTGQVAQGALAPAAMITPPIVQCMQPAGAARPAFAVALDQHIDVCKLEIKDVLSGEQPVPDALLQELRWSDAYDGVWNIATCGAWACCNAGPSPSRAGCSWVAEACECAACMLSCGTLTIFGVPAWLIFCAARAACPTLTLNACLALACASKDPESLAMRARQVHCRGLLTDFVKALHPHDDGGAGAWPTLFAARPSALRWANYDIIVRAEVVGDPGPYVAQLRDFMAWCVREQVVSSPDDTILAECIAHLLEGANYSAPSDRAYGFPGVSP